jgi:sigma-B regulation protein RsbU (phosphoserine phosphatase)
MNTFLESLAPDLREAIKLAASEVHFSEGEAVFNRGDVGLALYVIEKGSVRVHDGDLVLNRLGPGEVFGEIAGLGGMERTASVTAEADLELLRVEREALYGTLRTRPEALKGLVSMLCERESGLADRMTDRSWKLRAAEHELEIGRQIQSGFLPDVLPKTPGYEIEGHFQAARVVAGDFYDAFDIAAINRIALVLGDVCDKGVGAALFMTLFRSLIRAAAQSRDFSSWGVEHDPAMTAASEDQDNDFLANETLANTVALTNNYVATTHGKTSMFASAFIGLLDPDSGALTYVNAGHEEAYIFGNTGISATLPPTGPVLGIFAGAGYEIATTRLAPGDLLLLYSDGVPEATDKAGEQFSGSRLRALLSEFDGSANGVIETIISSINEFTEGAAQHDDITLLATRRETG